MNIEDDVNRFEADLDHALNQVRDCVAWLRSAPTDDLRFLVAERLPALGSAAVPELQRILDDSTSSRGLRYLAAWVAVEVGDRGDSVSVLCSEVEAGAEWSLPAANILAKHRILEGARVVAEALDRVDPRSDLEVMGYATALRDLGGKLPESVRQRIVAESSPWIARAVATDFPAD